jgi:hypothetical protein
VFTVDGDGQVRFAEAAGLTPGDCAAVQQHVRGRVLSSFSVHTSAVKSRLRRWFASAPDEVRL